MVFAQFYFCWKRLAVLSAIVFCLLSNGYARAGVVLGATRLIYPSDAKEMTLSLKNTERSQTFLVQSVIEDARSEKQPHFVVTPPLFVLKPEGENKLRIFLKNATPMSANKETLFWISVKAVPSISKQEEGNFVQFAVTNRIKLLYRPKGLASPDEAVWRKISFSRRGKELLVHNPTSYYMHIASVHAGQRLYERLTLAPDETQVLGSTSVAGNIAEVVFINDFGGESSKVTVPVN